MANNYNSTLQSNNTDLQAILSTINNLPKAGEPVAQATPSIAVNSSTGLITATATQSSGYVDAGTQSSTYQLAFQAAKTITPTTTSQTAVSSGYYTGGDITVAGDSNLIAENIKDGTSIFGVTGTYVGSGGSGGDTSVEDGLIAGTISEYTNDRVRTIGDSAFYYHRNLTTVSFPMCTTIGLDAFYGCYNLTSVSFPNVTTIGTSAFYGCGKLTATEFPNCVTVGESAFMYCHFSTIQLPNCKTIGASAFSGCTDLKTISLPNCTYINNRAFFYCSQLSSIYLMGSTLCSLGGSQVFMNAGINTTEGSIFVPASLVSSYKSATNWSRLSNRIFGVE